MRRQQNWAQSAIDENFSRQLWKIRERALEATAAAAQTIRLSTVISIITWRNNKKKETSWSFSATTAVRMEVVLTQVIRVDLVSAIIPISRTGSVSCHVCSGIICNINSSNISIDTSGGISHSYRTIIRRDGGSRFWRRWRRRSAHSRHPSGRGRRFWNRCR